MAVRDEDVRGIKGVRDEDVRDETDQYVSCTCIYSKVRCSRCCNPSPCCFREIIMCFFRYRNDGVLFKSVKSRMHSRSTSVWKDCILSVTERSTYHKISNRAALPIELTQLYAILIEAILSCKTLFTDQKSILAELWPFFCFILL